MAHDAQMLKGVLALLLLSLLSEQDGYGYSIVTRLKAAGFDDLAEGTVYPALTRLEAAGLLESRLERSASGPARKYYRTTELGRAELATRAESWRALVAAVDVATAPAVATSSSSSTAAPQGVPS